jgi:hypothetical protein
MGHYWAEAACNSQVGLTLDGLMQEENGEIEMGYQSDLGRTENWATELNFDLIQGFEFKTKSLNFFKSKFELDSN